MEYPFSGPVTCADFGKAVGVSFASVRRMVRAGILPVVHFPNGDRIPAQEANRVVEQGFTKEQLSQLSDFIASLRAKPSSDAGEAA